MELGVLVGVWSWLIRSRHMSPTERVWGDLLVGVGLALLATKPQAVGLPIVLIGLWSLSRRRWAVPAAAVLSLAALLVVPNLFYPNALQDWLTVVTSGQASSQAEVSASVWGLSYQWLGWLGPNMPWVGVAGVLSVVGVVALMPRWWADLRDGKSPVPMSLPLTVCMNSVISPYMLGYEHVLLLLPGMVLLGAAGLPDEEVGKEEGADRKRWRMALYLWLAVLPMLVVAVQGVTGKEYPAIAQSIPMLVICWLTSLQWKEAAASPASSRENERPAI
jgi:hypothetical protein